MKNLKTLELGEKQVLTRDQLKKVKGGGYTCYANTSCCGIIGYSPVNDQDMQSWYAFYAAAGAHPVCAS